MGPFIIFIEPSCSFAIKRCNQQDGIFNKYYLLHFIKSLLIYLDLYQGKLISFFGCFHFAVNFSSSINTQYLNNAIQCHIKGLVKAM